MKKTIAHISETYFAGDPNDLHKFTSKMDRFDSIVLCDRLAGSIAGPDPGINVFSGRASALGSMKNLILRRITGPFYERARDSFYASVIMRDGVSLVHAHFGQTGASMASLSDRLGIPIVVSFYGVDVSMFIMKREWVRRYKKMFKVRGLFVVLCEEAKERLVRIGCPPEKIRITDCLNDLSYYPYKERKAGKTIRLLIAARFVEKKGYPVLLEALSKLLSGGKDVTLTAIGYGSEKQKAELNSKIAVLGLPEKVRVIDTTGKSSSDFVGIFRENLETHDIFVLPSMRARNGDDEGGPALTLVNAQSAGLPVITTPFPGSERSVIDGRTGLYCEPNDPAALAGKLDYLIANPSIWNSLGKAASVYVNEHLSLSRELERITDIYEELL